MNRLFWVSLVLGSAACAAQENHPAASAAAPAITIAPLKQASVTSDALGALPALPDLSPRAGVSQVVGITHMRVDYSSPASRERTVWGELIPYGATWRMGANAATRLEFNHPIQVGDATVPAGSYTLLAVVQQDGPWTVLLNRDPHNRGVYGHDPADDVARVEVVAEEVAHRERLTFLFEDTTEQSTHLVFEWAGRRLRLPIHVDTASLVEASIEATMSNAWRPPYQAARYLLESGDAQRAAELLDKSLALHVTPWNLWFHALAMAKLERQEESCASAKKALAGAEEGTAFQRFYSARVQEHLARCGD